jgi:hypothetical protein
MTSDSLIVSLAWLSSQSHLALGRVGAVLAGAHGGGRGGVARGPCGERVHALHRNRDLVAQEAHHVGRLG